LERERSQIVNNFAPEAKPFAIAGNLVFDAVGYVGGGVELLLDTLQTRPKTAIA
jgi:hypothetical protein